MCSALVKADVSCKLCTVLFKSFCCEVNNLHVPHDKKDSDKTIHNLQLPLA